MWVLVHSQGIAYYKHGTVPTYVITDTPILSASAASLAFDCVAYTETTKTVTISGANLEGDINLALSGANADLFEISQTTIDKATGSAEIKVTYAPTLLQTQVRQQLHSPVKPLQRPSLTITSF